MLTSKSIHINKYHAEDDKFIGEQVELIEERLRCLLDGLITKKEVMYDVTDSFFKILGRERNFTPEALYQAEKEIREREGNKSWQTGKPF